MKNLYSFESIKIGDEVIAVPVGKDADKLKGVIKLNEEGLEILNLLKNVISLKEIVNELSKKYENDEESLTKYVISFLTIMKGYGLITDSDNNIL